MTSKLNKYIRVFQMITGLVQENKSHLKKLVHSNESYPGLNSENTPMRVFYPKNPINHTLILFPGASPSAEKHPKMNLLAKVFANAGYLVFLPRIPPLKELIISLEIIDWMGHFFQWLQARENVLEDRIVVIGISFGGAMVLKASLRNEFQKHPPKSMLVFGTHYDIETALRFLLAGKLGVNGHERIVQADEWGLIVLFHNYLSRVDVGYDTTTVQKILKLSMKEDSEGIENELENISGREKKLIIQILAGKINEEIERITALFWEECKNEFKNISPKYWCDQITQKVFVMHGVNDTMAPFTESVKLADGLTDSRLLISYMYEHREIATQRGIFFQIKELLKIFFFLFEFIQYNER